MSKDIHKRPLFVGFASVKGGVGKSTLAELVASEFYYRRGVRLLVVDCDYGQYSFYHLRERDKETVLGGSEALQARIKKHFEKLARPSYTILKSQAKTALLDVQKHLEQVSEACDLVIFDLPGRANEVELIELTLAMDYVISPIEPDRQSMVASMSYALAISELGAKQAEARLRQIYLLWNKVDRRTSQRLIDFYNTQIKRHQLGLLRTVLPRSVRFSRELTAENKEVFRCSYLPADRSLLVGCQLMELCDELILELNLQQVSE